MCIKPFFFKLLIEMLICSYEFQKMVKYRLTVQVNRDLTDVPLTRLRPEWLYWELLEDLFVPPCWRDVPDGVLEEWTAQIPVDEGSVILGGTVYTRKGNLLLPEGQEPYLVLTEDDVRRQIAIRVQQNMAAARRAMGV